MNQQGSGGTRISVNQGNLAEIDSTLDEPTIAKLERIRNTINSGITAHTNTSSEMPSTENRKHNLSNVKWRFTHAVRPTKNLQEFKDIILANMKRQSVSGPDAITLEIVLGLTDENMEMMRVMVNYILSGGHIPGSEIGQISPLQKDEKRTRPIALMNFIRKASETWVAYNTTRIFHDYSLLQPNQFGSILDGGCQQPIFILNQLMEYAVAHDR